MTLRDFVAHIYAPLLTQETAIMVSTFTYGLREGMGTASLVIANTIAVVTDLALFFVPTHFLSRRLHAALVARFQVRYDTGIGLVERVGAFRAATAMGFIMPSVAAMIVVGVLRLSFWRSLGGLFLGSVLYVVIPLLIALPLASTLPAFVLPALQWVAPVLAILLVTVSLIRAHWRRHAATPADSGSVGDR